MGQMTKKNISIGLILFLGLLSCKQLGLEKEEKDNTLAIAALAVFNNSKSSSVGSSVSSSCNASTSTGSTITNSSATLGTDCVNGVTTCIDSAMPTWIKDNFKCVVAYIEGTNYVFKSKNIPNHNSGYFGSASALYEFSTGINPNTIISQTFTYKVPITPTTGSGTVSTQGGYASVGITTNGIAIFNNAAAPGDTLATEATSFDNYFGHPQNSGVYHYHAGVPKVCHNSAKGTYTNATVCNNNNKLIGIALDGYPIYSSKDANGNSPTLDTFQGTTSVTTEFPSGTYNYRYALNSTATIFTLISSFFRGTVGSISVN